MNKKLILKKRPTGMPTEDCWELQENEIPTIGEGELLIENHYVSLDPAMRGWMNDSKSYIAPIGIGDVMRAGSIGIVIKSNGHPSFKVGDVLTGAGGVQQYVATNGEGYVKVDTSILPMTKYIAALGMPGMTAYFGILDVGKIKEGDVVLVSGAAGAVGSIVGQIAKIKGCTVVGIAGGKEKCDYVSQTLGFDACIDYKAENIYAALKQHCPKGIDVYFDNVGGEILDAALAFLRKKARVVLCGAISQYNSDKIKGPDNYLSLLINRASMEGMIVFDYEDRYPEAGMQMGLWMMEGKLKTEEDVYHGIENFYTTFRRLFTGEKRGKLVLKIKEDE